MIDNTFLFILAVFIAQLYIFYCVESVEVRVALAIFAIYQIWAKSRKAARNSVQDSAKAKSS